MFILKIFLVDLIICSLTCKIQATLSEAELLMSFISLLNKKAIADELSLIKYQNLSKEYKDWCLFVKDVMKSNENEDDQSLSVDELKRIGEMLKNEAPKDYLEAVNEDENNCSCYEYAANNPKFLTNINAEFLLHKLEDDKLTKALASAELLNCESFINNSVIDKGFNYPLKTSNEFPDYKTNNFNFNQNRYSILNDRPDEVQLHSENFSENTKRRSGRNCMFDNYNAAIKNNSYLNKSKLIALEELNNPFVIYKPKNLNPTPTISPNSKFLKAVDTNETKNYNSIYKNINEPNWPVIKPNMFKNMSSYNYPGKNFLQLWSINMNNLNHQVSQNQSESLKSPIYGISEAAVNTPLNTNKKTNLFYEQVPSGLAKSGFCSEPELDAIIKRCEVEKIELEKAKRVNELLELQLQEDLIKRTNQPLRVLRTIPDYHKQFYDNRFVNNSKTKFSTERVNVHSDDSLLNVSDHLMEDYSKNKVQFNQRVNSIIENGTGMCDLRFLENDNISKEKYDSLINNLKQMDTSLLSFPPAFDYGLSLKVNANKTAITPDNLFMKLIGKNISDNYDSRRILMVNTSFMNSLLGSNRSRRFIRGYGAEDFSENTDFENGFKKNFQPISHDPSTLGLQNDFNKSLKGVLFDILYPLFVLNGTNGLNRLHSNFFDDTFDNIFYKTNYSNCRIKPDFLKSNWYWNQSDSTTKRLKDIYPYNNKFRTLNEIYHTPRYNFCRPFKDNSKQNLLLKPLLKPKFNYFSLSTKRTFMQNKLFNKDVKCGFPFKQCFGTSLPSTTKDKEDLPSTTANYSYSNNKDILPSVTTNFTNDDNSCSKTSNLSQNDFTGVINNISSSLPPWLSCNVTRFLNLLNYTNNFNANTACSSEIPTFIRVFGFILESSNETTCDNNMTTPCLKVSSNRCTLCPPKHQSCPYKCRTTTAIPTYIIERICRPTPRKPCQLDSPAKDQFKINRNNTTMSINGKIDLMLLKKIIDVLENVVDLKSNSTLDIK